MDDGNYFIDVAATGTTAPVIDVNDVALAGELTIAAVNNLASIEPLVLVDDREVTPGKAKLRAVHASPNAPAVDIFVDGAGLLPALTNLSFKESTDYLELDPGAYTFSLPSNRYDGGCLCRGWFWSCRDPRTTRHSPSVS